MCFSHSFANSPCVHRGRKQRTECKHICVLRSSEATLGHAYPDINSFHQEQTCRKDWQWDLYSRVRPHILTYLLVESLTKNSTDRSETCFAIQLQASPFLSLITGRQEVWRDLRLLT